MNYSLKKKLYLEKISLIKPSKKNIIKISEFINKNFVNLDHSFEYKLFPFEALNIYKIIEIYGYGNCKHFAVLFKFFMDSIGVKCSLFYGEYGKNNLNRKEKHVYNIIEVQNNKYLIDTDFGIIKYKKDLIKYENKIDQKIFDYFYSKRKKKIHKVKSLTFLNVYDKKFSEKFNIFQKIFKYKKKLSEFYSDLYFVQIPYFEKKFKEKKVLNNELVIRNKLVKNYIDNNKITYKKFNDIVNIYSTKFYIKDYSFNLNNFPYLIVDIKVKSNQANKSKTFKFLENNKIKNYKYNKYIFENNKYFYNPIYSFKINSKKVIDYIEVKYQRSNFQKKLIKFLNKTSLYT